MRRLIAKVLPHGRIRHIRCEMVRVNRREKDSSATAMLAKSCAIPYRRGKHLSPHRWRLPGVGGI